MTKTAFLSHGFSLVEIMVTVGVIAVIAAAVMPNFRQYGQSQEIDSAALRLANILKTAQSSAASRIKCPAGQTALDWNVVLSSSTYTLNATCQSLGSRQAATGSYSSVENSPNTYQLSFEPACAQAVTFVFVGRSLSYKCGATDGTSWPVTMTLSNSGTSETRKVIVESGGVIRIQ